MQTAKANRNPAEKTASQDTLLSCGKGILRGWGAQLVLGAGDHIQQHGHVKPFRGVISAHTFTPLNSEDIVGVNSPVISFGVSTVMGPQDQTRNNADRISLPMVQYPVMSRSVMG